MILAADSGWVSNAIRTFFAMLDKAIYGFIANVYRILLYLADYQLFTNETLFAFSQKVYSLLGLFMLFKVSFSFINYIVNPDSFLDKQKGAGKLIQHIVISLVMLVCAPFAFSLLRQVQVAIIDDQIIPKFFLGNSGSNADMAFDTDTYQFEISDKCAKGDEEGSEEYQTSVTAKSQEDMIALWMFRPFYQPYDPKIDDIDHEIVLPKFYCSNYISATVSTYLESYIYEDSYGIEKQGENLEKYSIDYKVGISTVVGIVGLLILISFCFDVAIRTIKLAFLQIIAPIPIVSYIDPDSSKKGMFKKWLSEVGTTWAGLFVRLAAFFFAIYVIQLISKNDFGQFEGDKYWVVLFLILGALMFAKQLPKLISEMTGIKLDGNLQLNPFKRVSNEALGGKQIMGAAVGLGAAGIGAAGALGGHLWYLNQARRNFSDKQKDAKDNMLEAQRQRQLKHQAEGLMNRNWQAANHYNQLLANNPNLSQADRARYESMRDRYLNKANSNQTEMNAAAEKEKEARKKFKVNYNAMKKAELENNENRLYPNKLSGVVGIAGTAAKGAYFGAKGGYKSGKVSQIPSTGIKGITQASKERNDREKRSSWDDIRDKATDIFGVKNDSGTTSLANKEIKKLTNVLDRYRSDQQRLTYQISNLGQQFASNQAEYNRVTRTTVNNEGKLSLQFGDDLATAYGKYSAASAGNPNMFSQADFDSIYSNMIERANVENSIHDLQKQIKEQEALKRKPGGGGHK